MGGGQGQQPLKVSKKGKMKKYGVFSCNKVQIKGLSFSSEQVVVKTRGQVHRICS